MSRLSFSGHESFFCKQFWLKKGYDYTKNGKAFSDPTAVVELGVGKNMVSSIRFWLKAFGINNESDRPNELGNYLFGKNGWDIYLEDYGTLCLLHYHLVKTGRASIYSLVFNQFRKERIEFTKEQLHNFLKRRCLEKSESSYNVNTINKDVSVFIRTYKQPDSKKGNIEDEFSGLLTDLNLLSFNNDSQGEWYRIEGKKRKDLPFEIVLFVILEMLGEDGKSISFNELLIGENSPGQVFALNSDGLYDKLMEITAYSNKTSYTETAGNRVFQLSEKLDKYKILDDYFNRI